MNHPRKNTSSKSEHSFRNYEASNLQQTPFYFGFKKKKNKDHELPTFALKSYFHNVNITYFLIINNTRNRREH